MFASQFINVKPAAEDNPFNITRPCLLIISEVAKLKASSNGLKGPSEILHTKFLACTSFQTSPNPHLAYYPFNQANPKQIRQKVKTINQ
jgi:hypothetical protein